MMTDFSDQTVFITGGTSGLGLACQRRLPPLVHIWLLAGAYPAEGQKYRPAW